MLKYFLAPLILLVAFAFYEHGYRVEMRLREEQAMQVEAEHRAELAREQAEYQARVLAEARRAAEERARVEEEKRARRAAQEAAWNQLNHDYEQAVIDRDDRAQRSFDLSVTLRDEEDLHRRVRETLDRAREEKAFLENWLPVAETNLGRLRAFLQRVAAAELARKEAEAATSTKKRS
jgi:hypothetical protein